MDKLINYFAPKKCKEFEIYKFRQATQEANEPTDTFHTRLRKLSENCKFDSNDKEIGSQIIQGCDSTRLRRKALRDDMTLDTLIKEARALELSEKHVSQIEHKSADSEKIAMFKRRRKLVTLNNPYHGKRGKLLNVDIVGWIILIKTLNAQRKVKTCNFCKKKNHFASVCHAKKRQARSRTVHNVESSDETRDNETENYLFGLSSLNAMTSRPKIRIHVNEHPVKILIDTGSSINVMDESTYKSMKQKPKLCKSDTKVYAYGANEKVSLLGKFQTTVETSDKITFYVT